ncbi:MAG: T9SS C-terminal target domain-containing protein, partial [Planctomycetes bacterium]|nr:T9SS C-terminal target domain-containing protein [Planctomycetota bacterium]
EFNTVAGGDVIVEIRPQQSASTPSDSANVNRVILNGFELDSADPAKRASRPSPDDGDEHVPERPPLVWRGSDSAAAYEVYFGTDRDTVARAMPSSPEFHGRQTEARFSSDAADHFAMYYWRVDTVHSANGSEAITKGDVWSFRVRHLAFPGAEGYGQLARGGRGGRVIKVTNLNESGPGSLRAAIEAEGPRTVVFDVSGRIVLQNRMGIRNPYLTIAGQTAPGKGICISNLNLGMMGTHDVIVRYIRVRPGDTSGLTLDGMGMASTDHSIIDHCSISWTQDEAFSSRGAKNVTLQRTLISEALNVAGHKNYGKGKQHGFAASIGGDIGSFHHNLLAHCAGRNWSLAGGLDKAGRHTARLDIRNNVVYNWSHRTTDGGAMQVNFVNNYYKPGPATRVFHVLMPERHLIHAFGPQEYYVAGNVMEGRYDADQALAGVVAPRNEPMENFLVDEPFFESHVTTQSADEAFENVLADVGCNLPMLDEHDRRVIEETRAGTTTYNGSITGYPGLPDSQKDVGGWEDYPEEHRPANWDTDEDGMPNAWETRHGFNPSDGSDGALDANGDGYTNLEDYLNGIVAESATKTNAL